jgi:sterol 3beta-glucosyltransferase
MAKIVIAAFGTRGDVAPLTGIGCRLREASHDVVLTAPSLFGDLITRTGLAHLPHDIGGPSTDVDPSDVDPSNVNPLTALISLLSPAGMRSLGEALLDVLRDEPADLLLLSPFTELAGHPLAEAKGIPSIGVRLQPLSATSAFPPAILGSWSAGASINRAAGRLTRASVDRLYAGTVAHFRARLGLPATTRRRRRQDRAEWPVLYGFSPTVVPRPADWRPGVEVVGNWWPSRPENWQPPKEVVSFLESGAPPVFLSFGSLPMRKAEAARLSELVSTALRKAGVRGIIQSGWAGLRAESDDILTVGEIPHDWLFGKVAAVVHSCGAGTTAAGLRAGLPAVAIPQPGGDQPFWARRLRELGASAATLSRRRLTADQLATAIEIALTDSAYRARAVALSARLAEEDGAGQALAAVERLVRVG